MAFGDILNSNKFDFGSVTDSTLTSTGFATATNDALILGLRSGGTDSSSVTTVVDEGGNAYTKLFSLFESSLGTVSLWYLKQITGQTLGNAKFRIQYTDAGARTMRCAIWEMSALGDILVDASASAQSSGVSNASSSGAITTSTTTGLFGFIGGGSNQFGETPFAPNAGWSIRQENQSSGGIRFEAIDRGNTGIASGTYTAGGTFNGGLTDHWVALIAAFKDNSAVQDPAFPNQPMQGMGGLPGW